MLETVTPLFLGGAKPRGEPELRSASLRGALRFWLRALLGAQLGDRDSKSLLAAENRVFGSTDTGASPVILRMEPGGNIPSLPKVSFSDLVKWDRERKAYQRPGLAYLFYSAGRLDGQERRAIAAGTKFALVLKTRPGAPTDDPFRLAYCALWLLTHLGGLGMRSRRGAGSLQVTDAEGDIPEGLPALAVKAKTPEELAHEIGQGLQKIRSLCGGTGLFNNPPDFNLLAPSACKIWVKQDPYDFWDCALDKFGTAMQAFRRRLGSEPPNVKNAGRDCKPKGLVERAAFGLPVVFWNRGEKRRAVLRGQEHQRRASPLLVRVTKLMNDKHALVLVLMKSKFLPCDRLQLDGKTVLGREKDSGGKCVLPNLEIIEQFVCGSLGEVVEVKYDGRPLGQEGCGNFA